MSLNILYACGICTAIYFIVKVFNTVLPTGENNFLSRYTWSNLQLFAKICGSDDVRTTITPNWIEILERHQEQTFPFTLWPLTYRTIAIMNSPSLQTPILLRVPIPEMKVKFYISNDVIIVCFTVDEDIELGEHFDEMCTFDTYSNDALVKYGMFNVYKKIKPKVIQEFRKYYSDTTSIVCIGYDVGAAMANFMSVDLSRQFKVEQEFLGLDSPRIVVDCITFSSPTIGNNIYWREFQSLVREHINIQHVTNRNTLHTNNNIIVGQEGQDINMNMYVQEIGIKINVSAHN